MDKKDICYKGVVSLLIGYLFIPFNPVQALETIVVSGTRYDSPSASIPSRVSVITADDIEMSGANHIVDVLRSNGGLQVSDLFGDGSDASIGLRGFSSTAGQNTLILIDGRRLNNVDNSLPNLNTIALENIEQIEIVKGSMGTLYGDKAVGGVINVVTRKPDELIIMAKAVMGSFNQRRLFASLENGHNNGISYRLSGFRNLTDNYRDNNQSRLTDISINTAYEYDHGRLFFEYQALSEKRELPGALFSDLLVQDRKQALNPDDNIRSTTDVGRIGIIQNLSTNVEFQAEYTNRFNDIDGMLSSAGNPQDFTSKRHHIEITPRLISSFPLTTGVAIVTLGLDWFKTDYLIQSDFGITDDTQTQHGFYARMSIPVIEDLILTGGVRHGKVTNNILVDTLSFGRSLPEGSIIDDDEVAWEAGFSYIFTPAWRVFGKLDKNYRFVTADEYSAIADNNFFSQLFNSGETIPFPVTQTGLSMELGAEWQNEEDFFSVLFYQLRVSDEIEFDPGSFLNTNLGNTRRNGVILEGRYWLTERLNLSANYSYLDAYYSSGPFKGNQLTFLSRHTGGVAASYRVDENFSARLEVITLSDRQFGGDFAERFDGLPGYTIINLSSAYEIDRFKVSFRINNLLGKKYSDSGAIAFDFRQPFPSPQVETFYPAPGRNFSVSLQYKYQ